MPHQGQGRFTLTGAACPARRQRRHTRSDVTDRAYPGTAADLPHKSAGLRRCAPAPQNVSSGCRTYSGSQPSIHTERRIPHRGAVSVVTVGDRDDHLRAVRGWPLRDISVAADGYGGLTWRADAVLLDGSGMSQTSPCSSTWPRGTPGSGRTRGRWRRAPACQCQVRGGLRAGLARGGSRQLPARRPGGAVRHCTTRYGTTHHEIPCDRRHTDLLTKMLTTWLAKTSGSSQTRRSTP